MFITIKTNELIGTALDWAVAKCEGYFDTKSRNGIDVGVLESGWTWVALHPNAWRRSDYVRFNPSTDWSHGGPIIDHIKGFEFKHWLESRSELCCEAHIHNYVGDWIEFGPTPLIAAMRCYVASKLGNTVQIPRELV